MENKFVISVLIPVKNEEAYLPQCIESILLQEYPYFELIICDNCSSDHTWDIANNYAIKDSRVKTYRHANEVSPVDNLHKCYELSSGNLIYFHGGDDYIEKTFFSEAAKHFCSNQDLFAVVPSLSYFDDCDGSVVSTGPPSFFKDYLNMGTYEFTKFYRHYVHNDELILSIFKREYFSIDKAIERDSLQPIGWWLTLFIFLKAKNQKKQCLLLEEPFINKRTNCMAKKGSARKDLKQGSVLHRTLMSVRNSYYVMIMISAYGIITAIMIFLLLLYSSLRFGCHMRMNMDKYVE